MYDYVRSFVQGDKIKRLPQANKRLQLRNDRLRETEERLNQTRLVMSHLRNKVEALYEKEESLFLAPRRVPSGELLQRSIRAVEKARDG